MGEKALLCVFGSKRSQNLKKREEKFNCDPERGTEMEFALKLLISTDCHMQIAQPWQVQNSTPTACDHKWKTFERVHPFFFDRRVLLAASYRPPSRAPLFLQFSTIVSNLRLSLRYPDVIFIPQQFNPLS